MCLWLVFLFQFAFLSYSPVSPLWKKCCNNAHHHHDFPRCFFLQPCWEPFPGQRMTWSPLTVRCCEWDFLGRSATNKISEERSWIIYFKKFFLTTCVHWQSLFLSLDVRQDSDEWINEAIQVGVDVKPKWIWMVIDGILASTHWRIRCWERVIMIHWFLGTYLFSAPCDCQFVQAPERRDSWRAPGSQEDAS